MNRLLLLLARAKKSFRKVRPWAVDEANTKSNSSGLESEGQSISSESAASPLVSDATTQEDLFNRMPFANRLADMIGTHSDPESIVFGLYGEWGSGKTTVLELTESELKKRYKHSVVSFWFNPWRVQDEAQLLTAFMYRLAEVLERSTATPKERFAEFVEKQMAPLIRNHSGHWKAGMKGCPSRAARIAVKKRTPCLRAVER